MRTFLHIDLRALLPFLAIIAGGYFSEGALAQNTVPAFMANPQPPVQIAPDAQFAGTTTFQSPPLVRVSADHQSITLLAPGSPLAASVKIALARKYRDEPKITPTAITTPQFPGSLVPPRSPFQPASAPVMGQPLANPTYKPDAVNEPMVDTSHLPLQIPTH